MTYEVICEKLSTCKDIAVQEVKDIPHGRSIKLNNGGIINCYSTGKYTIQGKNQDKIQEILEGVVPVANKKVFVVYGHDDIARLQLEALLRRWDLEPIILDQQASAGQTIIEKLEEYGSDVGYAIILATPDDEGKAKTETENRNRIQTACSSECGVGIRNVFGKTRAGKSRNSTKRNFEFRKAFRYSGPCIYSVPTQSG